jgi:hypothetical protein
MNMFFRITLDYDTLADEIVSKIPEKYFVSDTDTFLDPAFAGGQLLKAVARRLNKYGHNVENVRSRLFGYEDSIAYLNHPANYSTAMIANLSVIKYLEIKNMTSKFDLSKTFLVGNYPFNGDKSKSSGSRASQLYAEFVKKFHPKVAGSAAIMPSYWAHKNSKVKEVFAATGCEQISYCQFDNADIGTAYVISNSEKKDNEVTVVPKSGNQYKINLTSDTKIYLNADKEFISIFEKMNTNDNLGSIWTRSSVNRNNDSLKLGKTPLVEIPSSAGYIYSSLDESHFPGFNNWKVMFNNVLGDLTTLGNLRIEGPGVGSTYSVINLIVDTRNKAQNLKAYLESKIAKFIIMNTKTNGANSKVLLSNIPTVDLSKCWTDAELYAHFNLTQEEINYIEANVK